MPLHLVVFTPCLIYEVKRNACPKKKKIKKAKPKCSYQTKISSELNNERKEGQVIQCKK